METSNPTFSDFRYRHKNVNHLINVNARKLRKSIISTSRRNQKWTKCQGNLPGWQFCHELYTTCRHADKTLFNKLLPLSSVIVCDSGTHAYNIIYKTNSCTQTNQSIRTILRLNFILHNNVSKLTSLKVRVS